MSQPPFPLSIIGDVFHLFYVLIVNLLILIINFFETFHIPGALGFSIIILTIGIRLLVWPFMATQLKASKKMMELKPHMDKLKEKHGTDKQALALAQSQLYKEHGVNPAAGCLPALIQLPVLYSLYQVIRTFFDSKAGLSQINAVVFNSSWHLHSLPSPYFLGLNLSVKPQDFGLLSLFLLIPVVTGLLQFIQASMMTPASTVKVYPSDSSKEKTEKKEAADTMTAVQSQMKFMMPLMIGYFAFSFPIGLAIYWNTTTLMSIMQQYFLTGWGGMADVIKIKSYISNLRK